MPALGEMFLDAKPLESEVSNFFPYVRESLFHEKHLHSPNVGDRPEFVLCIKEMCFPICSTSCPDFVEAFPEMCKAAVSICLELDFWQLQICKVSFTVLSLHSTIMRGMYKVPCKRGWEGKGF